MTIAAFRFHKGGTNQYGMNHNAYTEVTWSCTKYNYGGGTLSNNKYIVPGPVGEPRILKQEASVWMPAYVRHDGYQNLVLKFTRNGGDMFANVGTAAYGSQHADSGTNFAAGSDYVEGGDEIGVLSYSLSTTGYPYVWADGHPAHTWWSGVLLPLPPDP